MPRTGGEKTRARILEAAEALFAAHGFDGTSVDAIASAAGVNKALIYYHFEDKLDVVRSLFARIIDDIEQKLGAHGSGPGAASDEAGEVRAELELLEGHGRILAVMLAESMKSGALSRVLFECAELVLRSEEGGRKAARGRARRQRLVHEFFTGFLPLVAFVALRQRFCEYFQLSSSEALEHFVDAFSRSHLASHSSRS